MAFATASSPANREPGDNAQTATPPQTQARPRQSPGKAEPPTRARTPSMRRAPPARARPPSAPGPRARQTPQRVRTPGARQSPPAHARAPSMRQNPPARTRPPAHARPPSAPEPASACQSPQRMPEPPTRARTPARAGTKTWWVRCRPCSGEPSPQRTPGRKPGSGALIEPTIGLRDANRATRRVPRALAGPSSESPRRRIVNFVRPWSKQAILRSLKAKTRDYLRYREAHARTTDKNVHFSLPRPRKTVCFDRQRPKPTVFRIAHPPRQPNPMLNKQHSRHRSRRWRASSPGLRTLITGIGFYHHRDWSGVTIPEFCRILDAFLRH